MSRRDTDLAHLRWSEDHRGFARKNLAFGANDVNVHSCHYLRLRLLQLLALLFGLFNTAYHVESLFGQMIVLAINDGLEAPDSVL